MKKSLLILVALSMLLGLFAGCAAPAPTASPTQAPAQSTPAPGEPTKAPEPEPAATGPKVLRINLGTWPDVVDPQKSSFVNEIAVLQLIYEGLVRIDENGEVVPGAAETWEVSEDAKTFTFHLRPGLKRADGTPMTAEDFEYAFKRTVDPRVLGEYNSLIDDVVGAVDARNMDPESSDEEIQAALDAVGVEATDDSTLVFTLDKPAGYFLMVATTWVGWPADPTAVEADPETWWTGIEGHNGNGPYMLTKWEENKIMAFEPNPNYWGPKPNIDRIEFYWITDGAVSFEAYRQGELDIIALGPEDKATVDADPVLSQEFFAGASGCSYYFGMNNNKPPFNDKAVRMAFAQAFDREAWANDIWQGSMLAHQVWIPEGLPGHDETAAQLPFDPAAAVQTLIDAGYGAADSTPENPKIDCAKLGEIKLTYGGTARNHARYQWIAGQLASVFNCPITLDPVDPTVYTAMVKDATTAPQYFMLGWCQDYPHPQNWLFVMTSDGLFAQRIGWSNEEFDRLFAEANATADPDKAMELYKQAQKIMVEDYPGMMATATVNWFMIKPYVKGPREHYATSDSAWPGAYGPIHTYDIDLSQVPDNYPTE